MKKLALIAAVVVLAVARGPAAGPTHDDTVAPAPPPRQRRPRPRRAERRGPHDPAATAAPETGGPYGGTAEARRQWEPTVQGFALAYPDTDGLTRKQWLANLRPYLERPVLDALCHHRPRQGPPRPLRRLPAAEGWPTRPSPSASPTKKAGRSCSTSQPTATDLVDQTPSTRPSTLTSAKCSWSPLLAQCFFIDQTNSALTFSVSGPVRPVWCWYKRRRESTAL